MTAITRAACATCFVMILSVVGQAQMAPAAAAAQADRSVKAAAPASSADTADTEGKKARKSVFAEDGPVDTAWDAQFESLAHALIRLPIAALLSAILAFRPRRRGTPPRQAPVIQTQIILAIVGAMVMLVVGASLARAFGIVGAAGLIRYRAKIEDPKDAGVMLSTLALGLATGVGLYLFAAFATVFVLGVLWLIESIDTAPYLLFDLTITAKDPAAMKEPIEGALKLRRIPFELVSTSAEETCYEVKMPLDLHTERLSASLMGLKPEQSVNVKWEHKKESKAS